MIDIILKKKKKEREKKMEQFQINFGE